MNEIVIEVYDSRGSLRKQILAKNMGLKSNIEIQLEEEGAYYIKVHTNKMMWVEKVICF